MRAREGLRKRSKAIGALGQQPRLHIRIAGDQSLEGALRTGLRLGPLNDDGDPVAAGRKIGDNAGEVAKNQVFQRKKAIRCGPALMAKGSVPADAPGEADSAET